VLVGPDGEPLDWRSGFFWPHGVYCFRVIVDPNPAVGVVDRLRDISEDHQVAIVKG
jgi:hypothetical protein